MTTTTPFTAFYLNVMSDCTQEQIAHALAKNGLITFDAIESKEKLLHLCMRLGSIMRHRDADETGLTHIAERENIQFIEGYQAFTASHLTLHTDGSSIADPPTLMVLWCAQPADEGGTSLLIDGKRLHQVLTREYPQMLRILTTPNSAIFAGAEIPLLSSVFSMPEHGTVCIRFRYDNMGYYTSPVSKILPTFLELLNQYKIAFSLHKHQGYIVHNKRWLHGRTAFCGRREMYRVLIRTDPAIPIGKYIHSGFRLDSEL